MYNIIVEYNIKTRITFKFYIFISIVILKIIKLHIIKHNMMYMHSVINRNFTILN